MDESTERTPFTLIPPLSIRSKVLVAADAEIVIATIVATATTTEVIRLIKLLSNESVNNHFEYVYSFFDVPVSKEEADELEAETRRKAITIREGDKAKAAVSSTGEKQRVENPYLDTPPAETPLSEIQRQYNNNRDGQAEHAERLNGQQYF